MDPRQAVQVVVPPGGAATGLDFRLKSASLYRIRGRVVDPEDEPVSGAILQLVATDPYDVEIEHSGNHSEMFATSGKDGGFLFSEVPSGAWRVIAEQSARRVLQRMLEEVGASESRTRDAILAALDDQKESPPRPAIAPLGDSTTLRALLAVQTVVDEPKTPSAEGDSNSASNSEMTPGAWQRGVAQVELKEEDLDHIVVRMSPPFRVGLTTVRENGLGVERTPSGATATLFAGFEGEESAYGESNDGAFKRVYGGRYKVRAEDGPDYYLAAVKLGDRDVVGQEIDIGSGALGINLVFRPKSSHIRGTVNGSDHATVVLAPCEEALRELDGIANVATDSDGRFETKGLRPERYFIWAFDRADPKSLTDPAFARSLTMHAVVVRVEAGETATVSLSVTRWPD